MDARNLDRLRDSQFHLAVDKGCLDAMFCSLNTYADVLRVCAEVCRTL